MVEYDFTEGLYRAFVRTGYKNGNNEIESINGNKVEFESIKPIIAEFDYTGNIQIFTAPKDGIYQLEVWGASGGRSKDKNSADFSEYTYGGYSIGKIILRQNEELYVCVGQAGEDGKLDGQSNAPTYNGGGGSGSGYSSSLENNYRSGGSGGGATSIAKTTNRGVLANYYEHQEEVLIVAGGGGGWGYSSLVSSSTVGHGGGYIGNNGWRGSSTLQCAEGGTQSSGYLFGQGETGEAGRQEPGNGEGRGGGGGGWYGGHAINDHVDIQNGNGGGAGGSGYIGNNLLFDKKMVGYNVATSSAEETKTESVNTYSATAKSNKPKVGNGFSRITWLEDSPIPVITSVVIAPDNTSITITWTSDSSPDQVIIYRVSPAEKVWEHHTRFSPCEVDWVWGTGDFYVQIISGNGFSSEPWYFTIEQPYYTFSTNQNIKIDPTTLEVPNASLSQTEQAYGLTYKLYDNGLLVISGDMTSPRSDPFHDLNNIPYNTLYIYFTGDHAYYENLFSTSFYNVREIAFYTTYRSRTEVQSAENMFENCASLLNIDFGTGFSTYKIDNMNEMFAYCSHLISLDFSKAIFFSTGQVLYMNDMFSGCTRLESIEFGDFFSTRSVVSTSYMFYNCQSLTTLDLSGWSGLVKLEDAEGMFAKCSALTNIIMFSGNVFSTNSGYYSMESMFEGCSSLTSIDVTYFRIRYVTIADNAFKGCNSLTSLDFSNWTSLQPSIGDNGFIDGCTGLEILKTFAPRQQIILPKTMYDSSGTAYTVVPYTTSITNKPVLYATNPNAPKSTPKMLMSRSGGEVAEESRDFVEYNFASGELYRAFIRTGYKDAFNVDQTIDGNKYKFRNKHISYIQSQATDQFHGQYIDTGIKPSAATTVEVKVCRINGTGTSGWDTFIGCRSEYPGYAGRYVLRGVSSIVVQKSASPSASAQQNSYGSFSSGWHVYKLKDYLYIDGVKQTGYYYPDSNHDLFDHNLYLFALNHMSNYPQDFATIQMEYCKIWDSNDNLVRHFIPAIDSEDVVCMYDKVTKTFFYNQGDGNFTCG